MSDATDIHLAYLKSIVSESVNFRFSSYKIESESKEYDAARFELNDKRIVYRKAKVTPKKVGQFVTCWKRNLKGETKPLSAYDNIDFYLINVSTLSNNGFFILPKKILIKKGILSSYNEKGKRGFRVYPQWDIAMNKQAMQTQKWQLQHFYDPENPQSLSEINQLFSSDFE